MVFLLFLSLASCEKKDAGQIITLAPGETYRITETQFYEMDPEWSFASEDPHIAEVIGREIVAHNVGLVTVTAKMGGETVKYKVSVEDDEQDREYKIIGKEVRDSYVYLGAGYNASKASQFLTAADLITTNQLITSKMVENMFYPIYRDKTLRDEFICMEGTDAESYSRSYGESIKGSFGVDLYGICGATVGGAIKKAREQNKDKSVLYSTVMGISKRNSYWVQLSKEELANIAKQNAEGWKALTGTDGTTPSQFIEKYGTHIVTKVHLGGRLDLNYLLVSDRKEDAEDELTVLSGLISGRLMGLKVEGRVDDTKTFQSVIRQYHAKETTNVKMYGGRFVTILSLEKFNERYKTWYDSITDENMAFIGAGELIPMWELLDEEIYKERREALKREYDFQMRLKQLSH